MFLEIASAGFSAWLSVVSFCGIPVYLTGMTNDGQVLMGQYRYILEDDRSARTFAEITAQLPKKKGEPVINQIKVEKQLDLGCPIPA